MEQIYCVYYNNIYSLNPRIVGYYTDLNIAEKHLRKIGKIYREKKYIVHYTSDIKMLVVKDVATYTIKAHEVNKIDIFNIE
jgi:hypothetical protein